MGEATDQAKRQVDLSRAALAADLERLEARVRTELDWRARLRRQGPQIIAIGGGILVLVAVSITLRRRFRRPPEEAEAAVPATFGDVARELQALREELAELRKSGTKKGGEPLWQKITLSGATAAASAGGRYAAKRAFDAQEKAGGGQSQGTPVTVGATAG